MHSVLHVAPEEKVEGSKIGWLRRPNFVYHLRMEFPIGGFFTLPSKCSLDTNNRLCTMKLRDTKLTFLSTRYLFLICFLYTEDEMQRLMRYNSKYLNQFYTLN
jgi:hypothetical protein